MGIIKVLCYFLNKNKKILYLHKNITISLNYMVTLHLFVLNLKYKKMKL